jgi:hypothetical protein
MHRQVSAALFSIIILTSCTSKDPQILEFNSFPIETRVSARELQWDDCGIPLKVSVYDTIIVIVQNANKHLLYFFNTTNNSLIGSACRKGKGPGEFSHGPWLQPQFHSDNKDIYISMVDQGTRERIELAVFQSISSGSAVIKKRKKISDLIPDPLAFELNDSIVVGTDKWAGETSLFFFNERTESVISTTPKIEIEGLNSEKERPDFQEWLNISPNRDYFVGNFNQIKLFTIYDHDGRLDFIIKNKENKVNRAEERGKVYYEDIHLSDDNIYVVNANRIMAILPTQPDKSEVLVFNYKGRPIKKFLLDRTIMRTAMDFVHNRLYGYDVVEMTYVYFDLGKL